MDYSTSKLLQKTCLVLAFAAAATNVMAQTPSQDILEARQEAQIWTTYALSPYLRAHDLQVAVDAGVATLTGVVEEDVNKDLARQIALGVEGINKVENLIEVSADFRPAERNPEKRSYGEMIDDASLGTAVKSKLLWSKYTDGMKIEVDAKDGAITLKGETDTNVSKELAGKLAMNTRGVRSVDNQLVASGPSPTLNVELSESSKDATAAISDSWITTKVKSSFFYSGNIDGGDISVSTTDGKVALSGKLSSGAERALAIELAESIRGVKEVDASALEF